MDSMEDKVRTTLTDLARVATGFAVLGIQEAQVRRRELGKQLQPRLKDAAREAASWLEEAATVVGERVTSRNQG